MLGPDLLDPRQVEEIKRRAAEYLAQKRQEEAVAVQAQAVTETVASAAEAPAPRRGLSPEEIARRKAEMEERRRAREAARRAGKGGGEQA